MSSHIASHALKTLLAIISLWVLPWVAIFSLAALVSFLQEHFRREEPPRVHFRRSNHLPPARPPRAA